MHSKWEVFLACFTIYMAAEIAVELVAESYRIGTRVDALERFATRVGWAVEPVNNRPHVMKEQRVNNGSVR